MTETIKPDETAGTVPPTVPAEKPAEETPEQLMAKIAAAGASGDLAEVIRLGNQLKKHQADIQKAEAEKLKAEAEALAGVRERLATDIFKEVRKAVMDLTARLEAVKASGFTFTLNHLDANKVMVEYKSVALSVPTIKTRAAGGGGGSTGALKAQTGLSRHELVDQYASDVEKASITKAESDATSRPDSARYTAEKPVIKRILADNPHLIKH